MTAAIIARIEPMCLVPKHSAQSVEFSVLFIPTDAPISTMPSAAIAGLRARANTQNPAATGNRYTGMSRVLPNRSTSQPAICRNTTADTV